MFCSDKNVELCGRPSNINTLAVLRLFAVRRIFVFFITVGGCRSCNMRGWCFEWIIFSRIMTPWLAHTHTRARLTQAPVPLCRRLLINDRTATGCSTWLVLCSCVSQKYRGYTAILRSRRGGTALLGSLCSTKLQLRLQRDLIFRCNQYHSFLSY